MSTLLYQLEGTAGATVTAGAEGCSAVSGAGTMTYAAGGLFPGSAIKAVVTGDRTLRTDQVLFDFTQPVLWIQAPFRVPSAPVGGNTQLTRYRDSSGNAVAMATMRSDGKITATFTGGGNLLSTGSYLGVTFWVQHLVEKDNETQSILIYGANGLLAETVSAGLRPGSPIVDCQVGGQGSGSGTVVWCDRVTISHDQPSIVPDGSGISGDYPIQGTAGAPITAASEGADGVAGGGTAVYATGGLVTGSTISGKITGSFALTTLGPFGQAVDVRMAFQVPPTPRADSIALAIAEGSTGEAVASVWVRPTGKLELRFSGGDGPDWVATSLSVDNDTPLWILWRVRQAEADGGPIQTLTLVDAATGGELTVVTNRAGSTPITIVRTGTKGGPDDAVVKVDAVTVATVPLSIPGSANEPVKYVVVGACTPSTAQVSVRAPGASAVRVLITGDRFTTSSQVAPDASGRAKLSANALTPRQTYTAQPEIYDGTTWKTAGTTATWRQPIPAGETGTQLIAVLACQKSRSGPLSIAYDDLLGEQPYGPVDLVVWNGDEHYGNVNTTVVADHVAKIDDVLRDCEGLRRQHASTRTVIKRSDHDGGGNQNAFYHGDQILASKAASRLIYPEHPTNGGDPATDYEIWQEGRVLHIALDCRSNNRSLHSDPESSTKTLLGLGQRDAVIAALTTARAASVRVVMIYSDMGWLGTNFPGSKPDAWPWYTTERSMIQTAIGACPWPVYLWQGDWHSMIWADAAQGALTRGPVLVGGFAGTDRSTENLNKMLPFLAGEYTGVWPELVDGLQPNIDICQYGLVKVVDSGPTITVTMVGRDAKAHVDRIVITKTHAVDDPAANDRPLHRIVTPRGQLDLDDPAGRWRVLSDARPLPLSARTLGLATRPGGGSRLVTASQDAATSTLTLGVFDQDSDGAPGALSRNRDAIYGVLGSPVEQTYQIGPSTQSAPTREAPCIVAAEATAGIQTTSAETYTLPVILLEPWRSVAVLSWAAGLDTDLSDVALDPFSGSTAEITDALVSLRGPSNYFTVVDSVTGCGFRWNVPGVETPLAAGAFVLVDTANWTSYVTDHLTFDPSEGEEHAGYITSIRGGYDPLGVLLPLTPAREADGVWRIRLTVQGKVTTGETMIIVRARARFR